MCAGGGEVVGTVAMVELERNEEDNVRRNKCQACAKKLTDSEVSCGALCAVFIRLGVGLDDQLEQDTIVSAWDTLFAARLIHALIVVVIRCPVTDERSTRAHGRSERGSTCEKAISGLVGEWGCTFTKERDRRDAPRVLSLAEVWKRWLVANVSGLERRVRG
jgi:hypothetical protein